MASPHKEWRKSSDRGMCWEEWFLSEAEIETEKESAEEVELLGAQHWAGKSWGSELQRSGFQSQPWSSCCWASCSKQKQVDKAEPTSQMWGD